MTSIAHSVLHLARKSVGVRPSKRCSVCPAAHQDGIKTRALSYEGLIRQRPAEAPGPVQWPVAASAMASDDVDAEGDDDDVEEEREEALHQNDPPDAARIDLDVRYLESHAYHEREIHEIPVIRLVVARKIQPGVLGPMVAVKFVRIVQRKHRIHE